MDNFLKRINVVILIILCLLLTGCESYKGEITVHEIYCEKPDPDNFKTYDEYQKAITHWESADWEHKKCIEDAATTYKALPDKQEVVYWTAGDTLDSFHKLHNCAVRDFENWSCNEGFLSHLMKEGQYQSNNQFYFYLSGWHYWWYKYYKYTKYTIDVLNYYENFFFFAIILFTAILFIAMFISIWRNR